MHIHRSVSPAGPRSTIEIILGQSPEEPFRPGSVVSGRVVFIPARDLPFSQCQITFSGSSFCHIRKDDTSGSGSTRSTSYRHYRDRATFFHFYGDLTPRGTHLNANQQYEWPLQFTFPHATNVNRAPVYQNPNNEIWTTSPHELPPSFMNQDRYVNNCCLVEYSLKATITAPPDAPTESVLCLNFLPLTRQHLPLTLQTHLNKYHLASRILAGEGNPSIFGRVSDKLSKDTPRLDFRLSCTVPNSIPAGAALNMTSRLLVIQRSSNVVTLPPTVNFRIKKLKLKDFTFFRAPRDWKATNTRSGEPSKRKTDKPRSKYGLEEEKINMDGVALGALPELHVAELASFKTEEGVQEGYEFGFQGRIPGDTTPTFRSFAINRSYRLKIELVAGFGGKEFNLEFEAPNVTVFSPAALQR